MLDTPPPITLAHIGRTTNVYIQVSITNEHILVNHVVHDYMSLLLDVLSVLPTQSDFKDQTLVQ